MPEEEKKTVPIDTSGPDATIDIAEEKDESVIETETPKQEKENIVELKKLLSEHIRLGDFQILKGNLLQFEQ